MSETTKIGQNAQKPGSELRLRVISALVLAAFAIVLTWLGGLSFELMCAIASIIVYWEFARMAAKTAPLRILLLGGVFLLLLIALELYRLSQSELLVFVAAIIGLGCWEMVVTRSVWSATALAYAFVPYLTVSLIRGGEWQGIVMVLVLFGTVWGADITAYFTGRALGGPKLAPSISPGKTWSGFFGGLVGSLVLASLVVYLSGYSPLPIFFPFIIIASILSQIGDLVESKIKRVFGVKDSSRIIPGHGGVMDRIDGLIFAAGFFGLVGWALSGFSLSSDPLALSLNQLLSGYLFGS